MSAVPVLVLVVAVAVAMLGFVVWAQAPRRQVRIIGDPRRSDRKSAR